MKSNILKEQKLIDLFLNQGILHEVNRTFFHPISLALAVNIDSGKLTIYQTDDPEGFIFNRVNKFKRTLFRGYAQNKHIERQKILGFLIQNQDVFNPELISKDLIDPEKEKLEIILKSFSTFAQDVVGLFLKKHKKYDTDDSLFCLLDYGDLKSKLKEAAFNNKWEHVAAYACLLEHMNIINTFIEKIIPAKNKGVKTTDKEEFKEGEGFWSNKS